jgi:hypothetical protein
MIRVHLLGPDSRAFIFFSINKITPQPLTSQHRGVYNSIFSNDKNIKRVFEVWG